MEKHIITVSDVDISLKTLLDTLHVDEDDDSAQAIGAMLDEAVTVARPTAVYCVVPPEVRDGAVILNGVEIGEPFVHKMLAGSKNVVPYVASCGTEIEQWSKKYDSDFFYQFTADTIKMMCLGPIRERLMAEIKENYFDAGKNISTLNPGSLKEWPITGQIPLFEVLGGVTQDIGVVLSDSLLMYPTKSVSGIVFQSEEAYENCQLCPRENCPGRRAPYIGD